MAGEYIGLTCQSLCDALTTFKQLCEVNNIEFDFLWSVGEYGKGCHTISESLTVVLSDTISMLKHQQEEIERLKDEVAMHESDADPLG